MLALILSLSLAAPDPGADVFPTFKGYIRQPNLPQPGKGDAPNSTRLTAVYEWSGGRLETIIVTLERDPAVKERYAAERLMKDKTGLKILEVNKRPAYQWDEPAVPERGERGSRRLVVVLADDKVLRIDRIGAGMDLVTAAKAFDFEKVVKVLDELPVQPGDARRHPLVAPERR